jgi:DNA-binding response OmpR family regulator
MYVFGGRRAWEAPTRTLFGCAEGKTTQPSYREPMARILIADDDRHLAELLRATLDEAGFEAVSAHSGLAAAALIEREDFDLVILDVLMPGVSGDALADQLHQLKPHVPVLLMTGDSGDQFVRAAEVPRLRKPFSERELVDAVRSLLTSA